MAKQKVAEKNLTKKTAAKKKVVKKARRRNRNLA